jgi:predicted flap endonuclease-1-like 5' DNA nuclease
LNEAGVFTFAELGRLTAEDLRNILGKTIQRLADEDDLLRQARDLAGRN